MNTHFKIFTSYNLLRYLCHFIHVLIFVTVSKCRKSPKLTNIVIFDVNAPAANRQPPPGPWMCILWMNTHHMDGFTSIMDENVTKLCDTRVQKCHGTMWESWSDKLHSFLACAC